MRKTTIVEIRMLAIPGQVKIRKPARIKSISSGSFMPNLANSLYILNFDSIIADFRGDCKLLYSPAFLLFLPKTNQL